MPKSKKEEEDYMSNITSPIYDSASKGTEKYRLGSFFPDDDDSATAERYAPPNGTNLSNGAEDKNATDERQELPAGDHVVSSTQHNSAALNGNTVDADRHEQAWRDFVRAAKENGRNNSMIPLFGRWVREDGMDVEDAIEEAYDRYCKEWPDNIDQDAYEQLERAAYKVAEEDWDGVADGTGGTATSPGKKAKMAKVKSAIEEAKARWRTADILDEARAIPQDERLEYVTSEICSPDEHPERLAEFMAKVLRVIHGDNAYAFWGERHQSSHNAGCWYYTGQAAQSTKDDALVQNLERKLGTEWPECLCNCNFQKPQDHGTKIVSGKERPVGHRCKAYHSRIVSFTVECDKLLSTGTEPMTSDEKENAKAEQLELVQWIFAKLGIRPVMIVDSGNKSIQATYLLADSVKARDKVYDEYNYLGKLFSLLGADSSMFSVPRIYRAPNMYRDMGNGELSCQRCLHFDPAAPRYVVSDLVELLEEKLGIRHVSMDGRSYTSAVNGMDGGRPRAEEPMRIAEAFLDSMFRDPQGNLCLKHHLGNWYAYGDNGWRIMSEADLQGRLLSFMQEEAARREGMAGKIPYIKTDTHMVNAVMLNLRSERLCLLPAATCQQPPFMLSTGMHCPNLAVFRNGIVDIGTVADALEECGDGNPAPDLTGFIQPRTPDLFDITPLDYDFVPNAECSRFLSFLERIQPDGNIRDFIQLMFGWAISGDMRYQVGFILLGEGGCGKSTLLELLVAMMGGHVSSISFEMFADRFALFPLTQHKLNVCNEMPEIIGDNRFNGRREAVFKSLCCGESYPVEEKGKPIVTRRLTARPVFATNKMPYISDKSDGMYRRLRLIPFNTVVSGKEVVPDMHRLIIKAGELPGILLWALKGLGRLRRMSSFPVCDAGADLLEEYRAINDPVGSCLKEILEYKPDARELENDIGRKYHQELGLDMTQKVHHTRFVRAMLRAFPRARCVRARSEWGREYVWEGVHLKA